VLTLFITPVLFLYMDRLQNAVLAIPDLFRRRSREEEKADVPEGLPHPAE